MFLEMKPGLLTSSPMNELDSAGEMVTKPSAESESTKVETLHAVMQQGRRWCVEHIWRRIGAEIISV